MRVRKDLLDATVTYTGWRSLPCPRCSAPFHRSAVPAACGWRWRCRRCHLQYVSFIRWAADNSPRQAVEFMEL
jgi:transposase-like protein